MKKEFGGKITIDFYDNKGKKKLRYLPLPKIVFDSVYKMTNDDDGDDDRYYPSIYLEQCSYEEMKNKE